MIMFTSCQLQKGPQKCQEQVFIININRKNDLFSMFSVVIVAVKRNLILSSC